MYFKYEIPHQEMYVVIPCCMKKCDLDGNYIINFKRMIFVKLLILSTIGRTRLEYFSQTILGKQNGNRIDQES